MPIMYEPSPKHCEPITAERPGTKCPSWSADIAQALLDGSVLVGGKRFATRDGVAFVGQMTCATQQGEIWLNGVNVTRVQIVAASGEVRTEDGVRWYVAPLLRWLVEHWSPLLHETRLPSGTWRASGSTKRWARGLYLSMIEAAGDDSRRFGLWQAWAERHALRSAADGGILPDLFFQRIGDDMEVSWGDRIDPGTAAAAFLIEEGVSRVSIRAFGSAFSEAIDALLADPAIAAQEWAASIRASWTSIAAEVARSALPWYLDAQDRPGLLSAKVIGAFRRRAVPLAANDNDRWIDKLAPAVAMFGDVSPSGQIQTDGSHRKRQKTVVFLGPLGTHPSRSHH